jgi:hypothetical protein
MSGGNTIGWHLANRTRMFSLKRDPPTHTHTCYIFVCISPNIFNVERYMPQTTFRNSSNIWTMKVIYVCIMSHKSGAITKNDKNGLYSRNVINAQSLAAVLGNPLRVLLSTNPVSLKSATTVPSRFGVFGTRPRSNLLTPSATSLWFRLTTSRISWIAVFLSQPCLGHLRITNNSFCHMFLDLSGNLRLIFTYHPKLIIAHFHYKIIISHWHCCDASFAKIFILSKRHTLGLAALIRWTWDFPAKGSTSDAAVSFPFALRRR